MAIAIGRVVAMTTLEDGTFFGPVILTNLSFVVLEGKVSIVVVEFSVRVAVSVSLARMALAVASVVEGVLIGHIVSLRDRSLFYSDENCGDTSKRYRQ